MSIRILLCDDHAVFREGLRKLVAQDRELEIVGEAVNGREAVALVKKLTPDVVIMDVTMPELNGIESTKAIQDANVTARVLILSTHYDKGYVREAFRSGAWGYLSKECAYEEIHKAIRCIAGGDKYISPKIASAVIEVLDETATKASQAESLSPRERDVLKAIAEGASTKEIASNLDVSIKTVETYRQKLMAKLNLHTVADLTKYAIREGITSVE